MSLIKRMLIPTDFSPTSDIAFNYALDVAIRDRATVRLLHVIDDMTFATAYPDGFYMELPGVRVRMTAEANARLKGLAEKCAAFDITATTRVIVGRPAAAIVKEATDQGTDLIVMGTHGRSGFAHLMLGSVAERVLRTAPCPVLTVRETSRAADAIAAEAAARRQTEAERVAKDEARGVTEAIT